LSPPTVSTKLAQIAKQSEHAVVLMGSNSHDALWTRYLQGLWPATAIADEPYE